MRLLLALSTVLVLALPAHADYSGSAVIDWSSLNFTGVPVQMDTFGINVQETVYLLQSPGAIIHLQDQTPFDEFKTNTDAFTYAPLGSVNATANDQSLIASASLSAIGDVSVGTYRQMTFTSLGTGSLTMSVNYTLQHAGIPPLSVTDFTTTLHAGMGFGGGTGQLAGVGADLTQLSTQAQQSGTLTLTRQFQAGDLGNYGVGVDLTTHLGKTVPVPETLWLLVWGIGLVVGLVTLAEWRNKCA